MSDEIRYRKIEGVSREADRTNSFLEKSCKKPKRLSRLWKSLTHRKGSHDQTDTGAQASTSPDDITKCEDVCVDVSCLRLSENKEASIIDDDSKTIDTTKVSNIYHEEETIDVTTNTCVNDEETTFDVINSSTVIEENFPPPPPLIEPEEDSVVGTVHTQVDYVHYLVPDLLQIFNSSYYWGVMDRYEAEKLLETKPEGTFLLRDSAQEDFLFSVSFRRYNRSLHARIEQWEHKFSFDSHDSNVYSCRSVCGLIERYKDPSFLMFFEPMLTIPLPKTQPFSLQSLCRAVLCSNINYDDISRLPIPRSLMDFLHYYHYKQRVRVRRF